MDAFKKGKAITKCIDCSANDNWKCLVCYDKDIDELIWDFPFFCPLEVVAMAGEANPDIDLCPVCRGDLRSSSKFIRCILCGKRIYPMPDSIF